MKKNPFSVLGVPDTASDEQIRNAYRELARKYSDSSDDGKMQELNDAYDQIVMLRGGLGGSSSSSSSHSSSYANNMSDLSDIREKIRSGRIEDALVLLDGIPEQYRAAEWYYLKGAAQQRRGWLDYASENFDRACRMDPNNREYAAAKENLEKRRLPQRPQIVERMQCLRCLLRSALRRLLLRVHGRRPYPVLLRIDMKQEMKKTSKIALSAVFAALSVALMALVSIIPNLELALPAISGLFVAVIVIEVDKKWALGVWAAVSLLSLIVVPNKAAAIIYAVFFGYYPVLKAVLESKTPRAVEYIIKILTFSVVMSLSYFLMVKFMGIDPDLPDFLGKWAIPAIALLGIIAFLLYDYALSKLITFYCLRLSSKLRKILK